MTVKQAVSRVNERYKTNARLASECVPMEPKTALNRELEDAEYAYHEERMNLIRDLRQFSNSLRELTEQIDDQINKLKEMFKGE